MQVKHAAAAGTLESSDAMVTVEPAEGGIELFVNSPVIHQFGRQIREVAMDTLHTLGVDNARVSIVDKGALDCTLRARIECAVYRAADASQSDIPWGGAVR